MNKKGEFRIAAFLTNVLIYAIIIFIIFAIWGSSGGFVAISKLGQVMSQIPGWVYLTIGGLWLFLKLTK